RNYTPPNFNMELFQPLTPINTTETTHNLNFVLSYTDLAPDGYTRKVWTVNDSTTIHWHGIFQEGSNWYDGVGG
ncbi:1724_t:CDS:2, partial [Racocetra persica]